MRYRTSLCACVRGSAACTQQIRVALRHDTGDAQLCTCLVPEGTVFDSALITPCVLHDVCVICIAKRYGVMAGAAA